ncbi:MAG: glycosyltransferase family 2 protein [Sterolibacterium sp.]|jgi:glycosyltransferase involved in cell wall biosynthesis
MDAYNSEKGERRLSIYIPTFNRAACLRQLLGEIEDQLKEIKNRNDIEIVVSDNASQDNTEEVIREAKCKGVVDLYIRNDVNVGPDRNFLAAGRLTSGRYVWLLCDDDLPSTNSLQEVMSLIANYSNLGMFYLNRTKEEMTEVITSANGLRQLTSTGVLSANELLVAVGKELITASCLVLDRRAFSGKFTELYGDSGRLISPLALSIDALALAGCGYVSSIPLVRYRHGNNSSWSDLWPWIWTVSIPMILSDAARHFSNSTGNSTPWNELDELKTRAVLIMLFRQRSHPKIVTDWIWIAKNILFSRQFVTNALLVLSKVALRRRKST